MPFACPRNVLQTFSNNPTVPAGKQAFNDLERVLSFASVESLVLALSQRSSDLGKKMNYGFACSILLNRIFFSKVATSIF